MTSNSCTTGNHSRLRLVGLIFTALLLGASAGNAFALTLDVAKWNAGKQKLIVKGTGIKGETVTVVNANDPDQVVGRKTLTKNSWTTRRSNLSPVPCAVSVKQSNGETAGPLNVANRPSDCGPVTPPTTTTAPTTTTSSSDHDHDDGDDPDHRPRRRQAHRRRPRQHCPLCCLMFRSTPPARTAYPDFRSWSSRLPDSQVTRCFLPMTSACTAVISIPASPAYCRLSRWCIHRSSAAAASLTS